MYMYICLAFPGACWHAGQGFSGENLPPSPLFKICAVNPIAFTIGTPPVYMYMYSVHVVPK